MGMREDVRVARAALGDSDTPNDATRVDRSGFNVRFGDECHWGLLRLSFLDHRVDVGHISVAMEMLKLHVLHRHSVVAQMCECHRML